MDRGKYEKLDRERRIRFAVKEGSFWCDPPPAPFVSHTHCVVRWTVILTDDSQVEKRWLESKLRSTRLRHWARVVTVVKLLA